MSDPTIYVPSYSFSGWQATNPSKPLPAPQVDNELANVSFSITETVEALQNIRRSDGQLQNGIVTVDSLSPELTLGFMLKGGWTLGAHYIVGDGVFYGGKCYRCQVVNDATNANRPDVDAVTWQFLYSTTDLAGAMSIATYDPTGIGADVFARANHTGTQAISTVSGLQAALDAKAAASVIPTKADLLQPYMTVASAATTDIGAAGSQSVLITGTTTITSFGTAAAGTFRRLRFAGVLTLTHNITSLILPGYLNIQTTADDCLEAMSLGSGNWIVTKYQFTNASKAFSAGGLLIPSAVSLGYAAGAGGSVVQSTSKTTGVTLNKPTGRVTTHNASLASGATVVFTVTNSFCADTDTVMLNLVSGASGFDNYIYWARPQAGSFNVILYNRTGGSLAETLAFNFVVIKGSVT